MTPQAYQNITQIYRRAAAGDIYARNFVGHAEQRAAAGDPRARVVIGVMHRLDQERRKIHQGILTRELYERASMRNPLAMQKVLSLRARALSGVPSAVQAFRLLQQEHLKKKATSWSGPGSPRTGYHPMPNVNRVGVYVPGLGEMPNLPGLQGGQQAPAFLPLTPNAVVELLALASRILASANLQTRELGVRPIDIPLRAPAPRVPSPMVTTRLATSLVTQQNPMLQATRSRLTPWMIAQ